MLFSYRINWLDYQYALFHSWIGYSVKMAVSCYKKGVLLSHGKCQGCPLISIARTSPVLQFQLRCNRLLELFLLAIGSKVRIAPASYKGNYFNYYSS